MVPLCAIVNSEIEFGGFPKRFSESPELGLIKYHQWALDGSATAAETSRAGWAGKSEELCSTSGGTAAADIRGGGLVRAGGPAQLSRRTTTIKERKAGGTTKADNVRGQLERGSGEWHHRSNSENDGI